MTGAPSFTSARRNRHASTGSAIALVAAVLLARSGIAAEPAAACASEPDDRQRLTCYDSAFERSSGSSAETSPAHPVESPTATTEPASAQEAAASAEAVTPAATAPGRAPSIMSKTWELGRKNKRGTFVVRTYLPNFLLPLHYTSSINRSPSSPTHPVSADNPNYRQIETKLQISLRAKLAENLLLPGADLWFAYTQRSLWQLWDNEDSSPFRSTDYQPEAIYVVPVSARIGTLPLGWHMRMLQFGVAHQSNGQSEPLSRSWNRVYLGAGFERGDFGLLIRANGRLRDQDIDDNPDLTDYIGRGEVTMSWLPGHSTLDLTWRTNFDSIDRGSLQLDWTYPVFADQPEGLRWYAQLFTGYGETLLDYNHSQTRFGLGLTLFQF